MSDKLLTLSIIIPAYNEQRHIGKCLDAIAAQTIKPNEVIVVDNNCTDDTVEIAKSYPFVRIVVENKQGIVYARNAGFDAATSDIIGRIDADTVLPDYWVDYVKRFYGNLQNAIHILTGGGYFYNLAFKRVNGWIQSQLAYRTNRLLLGHYITWGSNMAFPRKIWPKVKKLTCTRDDIHEDLDFAIHANELGYQVTYRSKLKVGVFLKRLGGSRRERKKHLKRWPNTLRAHNKRLWWMGVVGNWIVVPTARSFRLMAVMANLFRRRD